MMDLEIHENIILRGSGLILREGVTKTMGARAGGDTFDASIRENTRFRCM
jgi:hypothetical protein